MSIDNYAYYSELVRAIEFHEKALKELIGELEKLEYIVRTEPQSFPSKLKLEMRKCKISQTELAIQLGVSQKTVSRYVAGEVMLNEQRQEEVMNGLYACKLRKEM